VVTVEAVATAAAAVVMTVAAVAADMMTGRCSSIFFS
jgi:hypothetical protein